MQLAIPSGSLELAPQQILLSVAPSVLSVPGFPLVVPVPGFDLNDLEVDRLPIALEVDKFNLGIFHLEGPAELEIATETVLRLPEHQDPTEEYIHVLRGTGTLTIDGSKHEVGPGDTVFMPANATVSYQNGNEEMVAIQVFAGPGPADKYDGWLAEKP